MSTGKNLFQMNDGHKAYGPQRLFDLATFAINEGEHVGVIGPNGAGKSTLFKILIGQEELDSGVMIRSQELRVGYLSQHDEWEPEETGNSYLEKICRIPSWMAKAQGRDLQVSEEILELPILSLSGGYRMRIKMLGLLGMDPNLMLLDEPTNYLDLETTLLLERFLQNYEGAFLLISHDREVLRRTTDHILEVEAGEIVKFSGNIDDYFEQKEMLRSQLEARAQNQALKRKAVMDFVNRFGAKATKAKQAQSRLKSLDKMEVIEFKAAPVTATIRIPQPHHVGKTILSLKQARFGYGARTVLAEVNLEIRRGDHVAVVGLNGAGKSTLLKGIAGTLAPLSGERQLGFQVEMAIFNQHVIEVLDPEHTVYESLAEACALDIKDQDIRDMAGSLLFSSESISKKIKVLSGGEKSRVSLGRILLQRVPCLLLDEPTNHLDFQTVEALTQALNKYEGTLIVVSHDRGFIRRVGTKILEVNQGQVYLYPGTYDEYVWSLQQKLKDPNFQNQTLQMKKPAKSSEPVPKVNSKERAKELKSIERKIEQCLQTIENLEKENRVLNENIAMGQSPGQTLQELTAKMSENSIQIQKLETDWLEMVSQRESLI
jgi:ATP-binding cassette subfamily F protein 3